MRYQDVRRMTDMILWTIDDARSPVETEDSALRETALFLALSEVLARRHDAPNAVTQWLARQITPLRATFDVYARLGVTECTEGP